MRQFKSDNLAYIPPEHVAQAAAAIGFMNALVAGTAVIPVYERCCRCHVPVAKGCSCVGAGTECVTQFGERVN